MLAAGTDAIPVEEWNKSFGGKESDAANSVCETSDGGYIIAGITYSFGAGGGDAWLVKTDAKGSEQWNKTFGGNYSSEAKSVQQTSDGGYILSGEAGFSAGSSKAWLIKTNTNGNLQWSKVFKEADGANSVRQTSDGGYIVTGNTHFYGTVDVWLMKTDTNGSQQWSKTIGRPGDDSANSVQVTSDKEYIIVGSTLKYSLKNFKIFGITIFTASLSTPNGKDAWLIKTDENGNELWNKTFGGYGSDEANSVQQTSDGGYIIAGWTESGGAGKRDAWLIKTDDNGNQQWSKTFGGTEFDTAYSVQQAADGGYIIGGWTESGGAGSGDAWLIKTDDNGNQQWTKKFGKINNAMALSVQQTSDGNYILAGYTPLYRPHGLDAWLMKMADGAKPNRNTSSNSSRN